MLQTEFSKKKGFESELVYIFCGVEACKPRHSWGPGVREYFLIHYIMKGSGSFTLDGHTYKLGAGSAFLIPPGVIARYDADGDDPWVYAWVGFYGYGAEDLLRRAGISRASPVFHCSDTRVLSCMFAMLDDPDDVAHDVRVTGILYDFMALLIKSGHASAAAEERSSKAVYFQKAVEYISMHYAGKLTVAGIASYIGIDRKYLHLLFREFIDMSPQQYLLSYRMQKACELMSSRNLLVEQVSHSVGYSDPFLFSKMFKKQIGISPAAYMKLHAGTDIQEA